MPELKQLSNGEKPIDPSKYLLIERFCEPALGDQYRLIGQGCELHSEYTHVDFGETCKRALYLAQACDIPIVYLSCNCGPAHA